MAEKCAEIYTKAKTVMEIVDGQEVPVKYTEITIKPLDKPKNYSENTNSDLLDSTLNSDANSTNLDVIKTVISAHNTSEVLTRISNNNKFYFNVGYKTEKGEYGVNTAIAIDNERNATGQGSSKLTYTKKQYETLECFNNVRRLKRGTTLANCVGFAVGRVMEMWGTAIDVGTITLNQSTQKFVMPSYNNKEIQGSIQINGYPGGLEPIVIPSGDAKTFYPQWPTSAGWSKSDGTTIPHTPKIGAIICWASGTYGHVGVVEEVYNLGEEDEFIVMSESGWSDWGLKHVAESRILKRNEKKNKLYFYGDSYNFSGFLYSPLCQLYGSEGNNTYKIDLPTEKPLSQGDKLAYQELTRQLQGYRKLESLTLGQRVLVQQLGYKDPVAGKGKVNNVGVKASVISINPDDTYPYAISVDGSTILGYYDRNALKLIEE